MMMHNVESSIHDVCVSGYPLVLHWQMYAYVLR